MRVLFLTPRFPYPPLRGDQVVAYHRLRQLSRRHEVTLLSFVESEKELDGLAQLAPYCETIETLELPRWRSVANVAVRAPFTREPLQVLYYHSARFARRAAALVEGGSYDLVHAYFHRTARYALGLNVPAVWDLMDSMQLRMRRNAETERRPKRWLYREELRRITRWELETARRFEEVIVVAEQDRACLPLPNVQVVMNGVDTDEFAPRRGTAREGRIVFAGNMGYGPNVQAVLWFAENCFPRIREQIPEARFSIVGTRPSAAIQALAEQPGIDVTGEVDSMPFELNAASVSVAPMKSGSGIQNKILEAMACELPVVATTLGLGSIRARPGFDVVVADRADELTAAVVTLLHDPERRRELGARGRAFVEREHSWQAAGTQVDAIYERAAAGRQGR